MCHLKWLYSLLLCFAAGAVAAQPAQPRYNSVELQAEAQREVQNDLLNAMLYFEAEDTSPAAVASAVNRRINDALRVAKEVKGVRVRSGNNQTFPVYSKNNTLQGWRGRGEIRLDSGDFEAASLLIGKLQASMQLGNISFSIAPETRRTVENELITEAIAAFKARADIARTALAGRSYKLQHINLAGSSNTPQPRFALARAASSAEVTAPNLEGGVSQIVMRANGSVEIIE